MEKSGKLFDKKKKELKKKKNQFVSVPKREILPRTDYSSDQVLFDRRCI